MTIKQAVAAKLQCPVSDDSIEVALVDRGLNGASNYTVADQMNAELAVMDLLHMIFTLPDIVEGDYQVSHPDFFRKIEARLLQLATKHGATDILDVLVKPGPTVSSKPVW